MTRSLLAAAVLVGLVVSGTALADHLDPQKKITPADQSRAKAMTLRASDLQGRFRPTKGTELHVDCGALDESDLTLTGEAESPEFEATRRQAVLAVQVSAAVFESVADARASWSRVTSGAGESCVRETYRRAIGRSGARFVSYRRAPFPRLAERSVAYRLVATIQGVRLDTEVIVLMQSRALAVIGVFAVPVTAAEGEYRRLARLVAARMKTAMRGA